MLTTKSCILFLSSFSLYQRFWLTNLDRVNGLVQERRNSIANALDLRLSCTNPSSWCYSKQLPRSHEISRHFKCLQFLPFCQFYLSNLSYLCVWPGRMHQGVGPVQDEQWQILRGQFKTLKENNHQLEIEYYTMAHGLNEGYTTWYTTWPASWVYTQAELKSHNKISIMKEWCALLPEASFSLRVLSLPASLCVCVCLCQSLVCLRDNSGPVQAGITKFGPKMQKTLAKVPIVLWTDRPWPSRSNLTWKSKFTPFWACPHHNSPPIQAGITKFGPEVQNTLVKILIVLGGNWPWPSRSNMTQKVKFSGFTPLEIDNHHITMST